MNGFTTPLPAAPRPVGLSSPSIRPGKRRIQTILLATDLSAISESAVTQAIELCGALGARLLVMNVIDPRSGLATRLTPSARSGRIDQIRAQRERQLVEVVSEARSLGIDASFLVWTGEAGQSIVSAAEAEAADLLVVGTRALDRAGRFLLGSVSDYVVNHSPCPVLIAR